MPEFMLEVQAGEDIFPSLLGVVDCFFFFCSFPFFFFFFFFSFFFFFFFSFFFFFFPIFFSRVFCSPRLEDFLKEAR